MSEENMSLYDLLNVSIGSPQQGAVNFSALHALLHAVLRQLGIREMKTRWRDAPPGDPGALDGAAASEQDGSTEEEHRIQGEIRVEQVVQPGTEHQQLLASPSSPTPPSGPPAGGPERLQSRIQTCEDGVSEAMKIIEELRHQQEMVGARAETVTAVEECCHRVDVLEETVRSLRDTFQRYPDPEELSQCVTWDVLQSALLSERQNLQKELVHSGALDAATAVKATYTPFNGTFTAAHTAPSRTGTPSSPHPEDTSRPAAPSSPSVSGQTQTVQEVPDGSAAAEAASAPSRPLQQAPPKAGRSAAAIAPSRKASGSDHHPETVEALRNVGKLKESLNKLEARVVALEEGKVDQSQVTLLRELVANKGSQDASNNLMDQLKQQRAVTDGLRSDQEKMDSLEDVLLSPAAGREDSDSKASHELRQQISHLRRSVQELEEDMKQLKAKQTLTEEATAARHLQDQLDDLRGVLEDMMLSLTSQLSVSLQDEAGQDESDNQGLRQSEERSALTSSTVNTGRELSRLFQHYEQLQDAVNRRLQQQAGGRAAPLKDAESVDVVNDVQKAILQLQAECENLHESTRCLHEDNRQKQSHIEELYKTTEELEEKKADKQMVESEIKADKSALESKVSRLQFDSVTEQLSALFHELLNKVTGHEQDWHKVIDRLSTEMECKLNRLELDSVKKQLEDRWKSIHQKLQAQGAPEHEDAAALRKQLVDRFHCLSCDRPVVKYTPGPHLVKLPSTPGFPSHKSIRPFTVYALEQFRQHYRSLKPGTNRYNFEVANAGLRREQLQMSHAAMCRQIESAQRRLTHCDRARSYDATSDKLIQKQPGVLHERTCELTDYSHLGVSRSCGGSHTITSASQRRSGLQNTKLHIELDGALQSEEVDIVGLDGHIYKGRLNAPAIRNTETKLPTISSKDGICKTKDKAKCSLPHKPAASPEVGHLPHSAKCSRSASSSSGRDWPVSALGCTSQSSITQASAAAESNTEPQAEEPLDL